MGQLAFYSIDVLCDIPVGKKHIFTQANGFRTREDGIMVALQSLAIPRNGQIWIDMTRRQHSLRLDWY
jgi:hypothetical protein